MRRRLPWILAVLLVLVVGGAIALVVVEKPSLEDARDAVDNRWKPLRAPLVARYEKLADAQVAFVAAGGGDRSVANELVRDLAAWKKAVANGSPGTQVEAANQLEAQATRLKANALGSTRLGGNEALRAAIADFNTAAPPSSLVLAYNRAVRDYEQDRNDSLRKPVARLFGYNARSLLETGT
jgi:hypothetical protein